MTDWAPKRFWAAARVEAVDAGFAVRLDARPLRTPAKMPLVVPTREMAEALAAEWDAQGDRVRPETMPVTRAANSAIDNVAVNRAAVVEVIAGYGETDLLCYRATAPERLRGLQDAAWDPLLNWAETDLGARLVPTEGVMFTKQPEAGLAALRAHLERFSPFGLTALHDLVALSGSLVIGLAVAEKVDRPEALWDVSRIDEAWQVTHWGEDEEAADLAQRKRDAFLDAERFFRLCGASARTA